MWAYRERTEEGASSTWMWRGGKEWMAEGKGRGWGMSGCECAGCGGRVGGAEGKCRGREAGTVAEDKGLKDRDKEREGIRTRTGH